MCYVFAPIILVVVGSACLIGYKLDAKRQTEIRAKLDEIAGAESLLGPAETAAAAE
jgi:Na+/melibiose symporter-like transporter